MKMDVFGDLYTFPGHEMGVSQKEFSEVTL
jgi:hypothetical protein